MLLTRRLSQERVLLEWLWPNSLFSKVVFSSFLSQNNPLVLVGFYQNFYHHAAPSIIKQIPHYIMSQVYPMIAAAVAVIKTQCNMKHRIITLSQPTALHDQQWIDLHSYWTMTESVTNWQVRCHILALVFKIFPKTRSILSHCDILHCWT
jgi:hypothetical protein